MARDLEVVECCDKLEMLVAHYCAFSQKPKMWIGRRRRPNIYWQICYGDYVSTYRPCVPLDHVGSLRAIIGLNWGRIYQNLLLQSFETDLRKQTAYKVDKLVFWLKLACKESTIPFQACSLPSTFSLPRFFVSEKNLLSRFGCKRKHLHGRFTVWQIIFIIGLYMINYIS